MDAGDDGRAALAGKRVLVVEDEMIVAMLIEDLLGDMGAVVLGPAARNDRALEIIEAGGVDVALLDVNLGSETTLPTAQALRARGIPFAFATGYGAAGVPAEFPGQPWAPKPFREEDLLRALAAAMAQA